VLGFPGLFLLLHFAPFQSAGSASHSIVENTEEVATAWATELERRSRDVAEGRIQTISWETARTEILKELEQRRAPRTAS